MSDAPTIRLSCQSCGAAVKAPAAVANTVRKCPRCGQMAMFALKTDDEAQQIAAGALDAAKETPSPVQSGQTSIDELANRLRKGAKQFRMVTIVTLILSLFAGLLANKPGVESGVALMICALCVAASVLGLAEIIYSAAMLYAESMKQGKD